MKEELKKPQKGNVPLSKTLRKHMTREERRLWYDFLRDYPIRFKRQKAIGKYIVDFYCAKANLAIELDGSQHYTEKGRADDRNRTQDLEQCGIRVVRFKNYQIRDTFCEVCDRIDLLVKTYVDKEQEL